MKKIKKTLTEMGICLICGTCFGAMESPPFCQACRRKRPDSVKILANPKQVTSKQL